MFRAGDKVKCIKSMPDYGYYAGKYYQIVQYRQQLYIAHSAKNRDKWLYADNADVISCFSLEMPPDRPRYANWEHA